jgi:hypothetical protein
MRVHRICAAAVIAALCSAGSGYAQEESSVTLGSATGVPGAEVTVPVYWTVGKDRSDSITAVETFVEYTDPPLAFVRAVPSDAAEKAGVKVESSQDELTNSGAIHKVKIKINAGKQPALTAGLVSQLFFSIAQGTELGIVRLRVDAVQAVDDKGMAVKGVGGNDGNIMVYQSEEAIPLVKTCFFYMH